MNLRLSISDHSELFTCAVTNTGKSPLIVGFDWLHKHNPSVDWHMGKISFDRCPPSC
ncbi:hypothetical protein EV401DRAFT_1878178, partial [Pisolithus croceorrhizus]